MDYTVAHFNFLPSLQKPTQLIASLLMIRSYVKLLRQQVDHVKMQSIFKLFHLPALERSPPNVLSEWVLNLFIPLVYLLK